jgi:hypothetical protein
MRVTTFELFSLLGSIVVLAGISVAIIHGGKTAQVINAAGNQFSKAIRTATLR